MEDYSFEFAQIRIGLVRAVLAFDDGITARGRPTFRWWELFRLGWRCHDWRYGWHSFSGDPAPGWISLVRQRAEFRMRPCRERLGLVLAIRARGHLLGEERARIRVCRRRWCRGDISSLRRAVGIGIQDRPQFRGRNRRTTARWWPRRE